MPELSRAKSAHLVGSGIILVLLSSGLFGLLYIIHGKNYEFGESDIFNRRAAFWIAIPIIVSGLVGVLAGITKKKALVTLFMLCAIVSTGLAGLTSIGYGLKVTSMRTGCGEDSSCRNSDTAVMIGTIVLLAALVLTISIWGGVKACQAKWGPSKSIPRIPVVHFQYTRGANGQVVTAETPVANHGSDKYTCRNCGGFVNPVVSPEPPVNSNNEQPPVNSNNEQPPDKSDNEQHPVNSDNEQKSEQSSGYESLDPASQTSNEYEKLQPSATAKDDGSQEKGNETQDLNTTTSTHAVYETMDCDIQGKEKVNEAFVNEETTAL